MERIFLDFFNNIKNKQYYKNLNLFLDKEYKLHKIYPSRELIFNAFNLLKGNIKVVIIGQDPYHEINQAMGLAFSVPENIKLPPSLKNIYKEIENEYKSKMNYSSGDLTYLATQGVLLINSILTVREGKPLSHNVEEYKLLMKDILDFIDNLEYPIVFMLWGKNAEIYKKEIKNKNRLIIINSHPSPLGANKGGWFNQNQFITCNDYLKKNNIIPIKWNNC